MSRAQVLHLGASARALERALEAGRLHRIHRGVYAVGHPGLSREGRWMAAVLAAGTGAVLSHRSAAVLWGLTRAHGEVVDVTTTGAARRIEGVAVHRTRRLDASERRWREGIPTTSPARTLTDLAEHANEEELHRALHQAEILYSLAAHELSAARIQGRRHATRLQGPRDRSRSQLEREFRNVCKTHGIPEAEHNVKIEGIEVDFAWRDQRVIVELDGWRFHSSRHAFETDRERDARLTRAGWRVLRFTFRQVTGDPAGVANAVRAALRAPQPVLASPELLPPSAWE